MPLSVTDAVAAVLVDLHGLIGQTETPPSSNRSPFIDSIADEFGTPRGEPWCALLQGHVRKKYGLWIPTQDVGATNEWLYQASRCGKWSATPVIGAVTVYGDGTIVTGGGRYHGQHHAVHVGCLVAPGKDIQGNTSAGPFDRNGGTCLLKDVHVSRLLGYVLP
jgi:hypothetical protein